MPPSSGTKKSQKSDPLKKRVSSIGKCNGGIEPVGGSQCTGGWAYMKHAGKVSGQGWVRG